MNLLPFNCIKFGRDYAAPALVCFLNDINFSDRIILETYPIFWTVLPSKFASPTYGRVRVGRCYQWSIICEHFPDVLNWSIGQTPSKIPG
jgi:hypothetical protein